MALPPGYSTATVTDDTQSAIDAKLSEAGRARLAKQAGRHTGDTPAKARPRR